MGQDDTWKILLGTVAALLAGKLLFAVVAGDSVRIYPTDRAQDEFRRGFEEISDDWRGFVRLHEGSSSAARRRLGATGVIEYGTERELLRLYRWRAVVYEGIAPDPSRNGLCEGLPVHPTLLEDLPADLSEVAYLTGRALARRHETLDPWVPDFYVESPFIERAFDEYQRTAGMVSYRSVPRMSGFSEVCETLATIYARVAEHPDDRVSDVRLVDYVRGLELHAALRAAAKPQTGSVR